MMKKQFQQVRQVVQDSSRHLSSSVLSSLTNLTKRDDRWEKPKIFGVSLEEHRQSTDRDLSVVIESCIAFLLDYLDEEGLFRISGSSSEVKRLKSGFEAGINDLTDRVRDPHAVAGTLKSYLRELPEPLLTHGLYENWIEAAKINEHDERLEALKKVCDQLPPTHKINLRYLIRFLDKLSHNSDANKMSSQNIAMSLTPSLIWCPSSSSNDETFVMDMAATNLHSVIVYSLVSNALFFFPDDIKFTSLHSFSQQDRERCRTSPDQVTFDGSGITLPQQSRTPKKTPKKPAPPPPSCDDSCFPKSRNTTTTGSNNNIYDPEVLFRRETSSPKISRKKGFLAAHSSSEALDINPRMSLSYTAGYNTGSLDRTSHILRRNSDKATDKYGRKITHRKSAIPVQRPTVPPPAVPPVLAVNGSFEPQEEDTLKDSSSKCDSEHNLDLLPSKDNQNEEHSIPPSTSREEEVAQKTPERSISDSDAGSSPSQINSHNDSACEVASNPLDWRENITSSSPDSEQFLQTDDCNKTSSHDIPKKPPRKNKSRSSPCQSNDSALSDVDSLRDSRDNVVDGTSGIPDDVETRSTRSSGRLSSTDGSIDELDNVRPIPKPRKPPRKCKSSSPSKSPELSSNEHQPESEASSNVTVTVVKPPKPLPPPKPKLKGENSYL